MSANEPKSFSKCCRFNDWIALSNSMYFKPDFEDFQNLKYKCSCTSSSENTAHKSVLPKSKQYSTKLKMIFRHNYNIDKSLDLYKKANIYTRLRLYNAAKLIPRVMTNYKSRRPVSKLTKGDVITSAGSSKQESNETIYKQKTIKVIAKETPKKTEICKVKNELIPINVNTEKKALKIITMIPRQNITKESKKELVTMTKLNLDANSLLPINTVQLGTSNRSITRLNRDKLSRKSLSIQTLLKPTANLSLDEHFFLPIIKDKVTNKYCNNTNSFTAKNYYAQSALPHLFKNKGYCSSKQLENSYNKVINRMLLL